MMISTCSTSRLSGVHTLIRNMPGMNVCMPIIGKILGGNPNSSRILKSSVPIGNLGHSFRYMVTGVKMSSYDPLVMVGKNKNITLKTTKSMHVGMINNAQKPIDPISMKTQK